MTAQPNMTKHMQWEASRKTTKLGSTTVTEIELTPEAKERLALKVPYRLYEPPDYDRMPWQDRIILGVFVGLPAVVIVAIVVLLVWMWAKGVP